MGLTVGTSDFWLVGCSVVQRDAKAAWPPEHAAPRYRDQALEGFSVSSGLLTGLSLATMLAVPLRSWARGSGWDPAPSCLPAAVPERAGLDVTWVLAGTAAASLPGSAQESPRTIAVCLGEAQSGLPVNPPGPGAEQDQSVPTALRPCRPVVHDIRQHLALRPTSLPPCVAFRPLPVCGRWSARTASGRARAVAASCLLRL